MTNDGLNRAATLALVDTAQLDEIHRASIRILEETGLNVHHEAFLDVLRDAGAEVRGEHRVRIPEALVNGALESAPSRIDIHNRGGDRAMILEGTRSYFGTGSDLEYTLDSSGPDRRRSRLSDVARSARLCDALPNIDFVMSYALPEDTSEDRCELDQFGAMLENTAKPLIMTLYSGSDTFRQMHAMACERCGSPEAFRDKPSYIVYGQFISPLQHDSGSLERLALCADNGVPIIYVPTIMMGASGPVTLGGALALANAECLAGLVMHQLRAPGAPFIYGGCVSPLDMRTSVFAYSSPEWRQADVVLSQLSRRYDLPIFGTAGASDAKTIDAQAGAEWAYSLMISALAGSNLIHDVGYLESGLTGSCEALVICDEIIGMVKRVVGALSLDANSLALDVVRRVGPAGHFVEDQHTFANYRDATWYPSLFDRRRFSDWEARGKRDVVARSRERVGELLGT